MTYDPHYDPAHRPLLPPLMPDKDLQEADLLLSKADALLRKHNPAAGSGADDDLPILTDVIDDGGNRSGDDTGQPAAAASTPPPAALPAAVPQHEAVAIVEQLIGLDTEIARQVEAWFAAELPQLVSRELERMSERLREEALAHMRATLLPAISEHIATHVARLSDPDDS